MITSSIFHQCSPRSSNGHSVFRCRTTRKYTYNVTITKHEQFGSRNSISQINLHFLLETTWNCTQGFFPHSLRCQLKCCMARNIPHIRCVLYRSFCYINKYLRWEWEFMCAYVQSRMVSNAYYTDRCHLPLFPHSVNAPFARIHTKEILICRAMNTVDSGEIAGNADMAYCNLWLPIKHRPNRPKPILQSAPTSSNDVNFIRTVPAVERQECLSGSCNYSQQTPIGLSINSNNNKPPNAYIGYLEFGSHLGCPLCYMLQLLRCGCLWLHETQTWAICAWASLLTLLRIERGQYETRMFHTDEFVLTLPTWRSIPILILYIRFDYREYFG